MKVANLKTFSLKKEKTDIENIKIQTSKDAAEYIRNFYHDDIDIYESCFILLLNRANKTIGYAKISQGGVSGTVVDVKLIAKYAVESLASGVILAHNHPSGNLTPSHQDIALTRKVKEALTLLDSQLLDHVILSADGYKSLADEGLL